MITLFYIKDYFKVKIMILSKRQQEEKRVLDDKIMDLALKKNLTYLEAKKMIEAGQSSLSDFRIK